MGLSRGSDPICRAKNVVYTKVMSLETPTFGKLTPSFDKLTPNHVVSLGHRGPSAGTSKVYNLDFSAHHDEVLVKFYSKHSNCSALQAESNTSKIK